MVLHVDVSPCGGGGGRGLIIKEIVILFVIAGKKLAYINNTPNLQDDKSNVTVV